MKIQISTESLYPLPNLSPEIIRLTWDTLPPLPIVPKTKFDNLWHCSTEAFGKNDTTVFQPKHHEKQPKFNPPKAQGKLRNFLAELLGLETI